MKLPEKPATHGVDVLDALIAHLGYMDQLQAVTEKLTKEANERKNELYKQVSEEWGMIGKTAETRGGFTYSVEHKHHPSVKGGQVQTVELFEKSGLEHAVTTKKSVHAQRLKSIIKGMISETEDGEIDLSGIPMPLQDHVSVYTEPIVSRRKSK